MSNYEVICGNIGSVYSGSDENEARLKFASYVDLSRSDYGRAGGEDVTLMLDGEIVDEFQGTLSKLSQEG